MNNREKLPIQLDALLYTHNEWLDYFHNTARGYIYTYAVNNIIIILLYYKLNLAWLLSVALLLTPILQVL